MAKKNNLTERTLTDLRNIQKQSVKFNKAIKEMHDKIKKGSIVPQKKTFNMTTSIFGKLEHQTRQVRQETLRLERSSKK